MAVLDGTWWSAWWGPMTWWLLALAGLLVLAGRALRRGLARLGRTAADPAYLPLYLDNDAVMGLFKMGNYKAALRKEVEERRIRNAGCLAVIPLVSVLLKVTGGSTTEVVAKYVENSEPISVIGLLLSVLRRGDALVEVRLRPDSGTVIPNRALLGELARTGPATAVPLSEIGEFVMVTGRFEAGDSRGETLLMRAPYADGGPTAHLRVVLRGDGLLTPDKELPEGQFQAHCLGKVTSWDPDAREVVLQYPVAVFR
ncbi:hypothetical protein [Streptomyces lavenduligriseus]|uniref:Uncharacterized protein n=1 Tax=Streptomyces lavenduligriseus TaxID=67315 RepID=A0ABT0NVU5_9ACTN|nr:hypothetical protein [Streptomyces lavenduligriseus]MCL3995438.1 hypothetical protein [Streptomyces lavenduligriseus]